VYYAGSAGTKFSKNVTNQIYEVGISAMSEDDASFPCPNCGMIISPEDNEEKYYHFLDVTEKYATLECHGCNQVLKIPLDTEVD